MLISIFRLLRRVVQWFVRLMLLATLLFLLQYSTPPFGQDWMAIAVLAHGQQFDYVGWEIGAIAAKVEQTLWGMHPFMSEADRTDYVRAYMADLAAAEAFEGQVQAIYADPNVNDPLAASADIRTQRDALRADLRSRQSLVEAILEGQVAAVLVEQGFGVGGQLLPPISMRFTEMPNVMVISPRDEIRFEMSINLNPMPIDEQAALEERVDEERNVSSLIAPLGGIALFPAMILESTSIQFTLQTFAHEWAHHYLFAFPLGLSYDMDSDSRIINETTAEIFGNEVGLLALQRYYPDLVPLPPDSTITPASSAPPDPNVFDFGRELNETRLSVDKLLAQGHVLEAEKYMEKRRQLFVAHGYLIRRLNQAWFAFYGGYQSGTPGVAGDDPIGPAIQSLRDSSPSVYDWMATMREITTRDALIETAATIPGR